MPQADWHNGVCAALDCCPGCGCMALLSDSFLSRALRHSQTLLQARCHDRKKLLLPLPLPPVTGRRAAYALPLPPVTGCRGATRAVQCNWPALHQLVASSR